jgi:plasmid replication initiation protein
MYLKDIGREDESWTELAQNRVQWRFSVITRTTVDSITRNFCTRFEVVTAVKMSWSSEYATTMYSLVSVWATQWLNQSVHGPFSKSTSRPISQ